MALAVHRYDAHRPVLTVVSTGQRTVTKPAPEPRSLPGDNMQQTSTPQQIISLPLGAGILPTGLMPSTTTATAAEPTAVTASAPQVSSDDVEPASASDSSRSTSSSSTTSGNSGGVSSV